MQEYLIIQIQLLIQFIKPTNNYYFKIYMKYFYLYILILTIFIFFISYLNTYINLKESFHSEKQTFILLGDSILKNNEYVTDKKSVEYLLKEKTNGKTICLAKDNSKVSNIYNQLDTIPENLNHNYTTIFLSVGGNDILSIIDLEKEEKNIIKNPTILDAIFDSYTNLINNIQMKFPNVSLILVDIYYPMNDYKKYHNLIQNWNEKLYSFAFKHKNNILSILKISNILNKPEDFTVGIEPSSIGSKKLVDAILSSY